VIAALFNPSESASNRSSTGASTGASTGGLRGHYARWGSLGAADRRPTACYRHNPAAGFRGAV